MAVDSDKKSVELELDANAPWKTGGREAWEQKKKRGGKMEESVPVPVSLHRNSLPNFPGGRKARLKKIEVDQRLF